MTLFAIYKPDGRCVGKCNAYCYMGRSRVCNCICNGENHCLGLRKALDNTRQKCTDWMKQLSRRKRKRYMWYINPQVWQPSLPFPEE
jgi:hypothetical protein